MKKLVIIPLMLLSGCSTLERQAHPDDPHFAPVVPEMPVAQETVTGSTFNAAYAQNLYSDIKAHRVGDLITINLVESTQANKQAKNELKKNNSNNISANALMGYQNPFDGAFGVDLSSANNFKGEAKVNQNNSLFGAISVNVVQVLPNGNLVVRGEKWLTINAGEEYIRVTGIIRPQDVASDNSIESTRVANARIQYSGEGATQASQRQGWLARFFQSPIWPF